MHDTQTETKNLVSEWLFKLARSLNENIPFLRCRVEMCHVERDA